MSSTRKLLSNAQLKVMRGCKAEELKEYGPAIHCYMEAAHLCTENESELKARSYSYAGDCYKKLEAWEEAAICYYHAAEEFRKNCKQYFKAKIFYINASVELKKTKISEEQYSQIATCTVYAALMSKKAGECFVQQGLLEDAMISYEEAYQLYIKRGYLVEAGKCKTKAINLKQLVNMFEPHMSTPSQSFESEKSSVETKEVFDTKSTSALGF